MLTTSTELSTLEAIIERGLESFIAVSNALLAIRAKRLYKPLYSKFEAYCAARWDMGSSYANKLISASNVVANLGTNVHSLPSNEAQASPLVQLDSDEQHLVWQVVEQTAPDGDVTAAHVKSVVNVFREVLVTGAIPDSDGSQIDVHQFVYAAITEETFERMQRQRGYITLSAESKPTSDKLNRLVKSLAIYRDTRVGESDRPQVIAAARLLAVDLTAWANELEAAWWIVS